MPTGPQKSSRTLDIRYLPPEQLMPNPRNARRHSQSQISKLKAALLEFGFANPILVDEELTVLAGHARLRAATELGLIDVPVIVIDKLSATQKKAFAILDNKMSDLSEFDPEALQRQLAELCAVDYTLELTGFETAEFDLLSEQLRIIGGKVADEFIEPGFDVPTISRPGDIWHLSPHRLACGTALCNAEYDRLLGDERADMVFTDPPYNLKIGGNVSGLGKVKHREFAMASGEMTSDELISFFSQYMSAICRVSKDGSLHYHCMDWRHQLEILQAAKQHYTEVKAACVWRKAAGGMGSFYRSQYEHVYVFKNGLAPHVNNVQLGKYGRNRTNVWDYAGVNTFRRGRQSDLAIHPTVKPVGLVADAIRDCTKHGGLVLDPFMGSGTTILAAERTGRQACGIEIDPIYVDAAVRRWQDATGKKAVLAGDGRTFDEIAAVRSQGGDNV